MVSVFEEREESQRGIHPLSAPVPGLGGPIHTRPLDKAGRQRAPGPLAQEEVSWRSPSWRMPRTRQGAPSRLTDARAHGDWGQG